MFDSIGKTFMIIGLIFLLLGLLIHFGGKIFSLGRLPGDIVIQKGNGTFYFPVVTSILLSVILSLALSFFNRR